MELINSKSILAKLMATENLTVEQRNVRTAFFDVDNRILTVPVLDNKISSQLYDLFMGHEVGHALYTPAENLRDSLSNGVDKTIINVVEDSRIERKIKQKYPGLTKSFVKGYTELVDRDFFETHGKDLNTYNLIDKINLFCKGGPAQGIKFDGVERYLLDKVENTQTFDEVIEVAREIAEYMQKKQEEQQKKREKSKGKAEETETDEDSGENSEKFELADEDDEKSDEKSSLKSPKTEKNDEKEEEKSSGSSENEKKDDLPPIKSLTDEAFRKNESKLFDTKSKNYIYANIPDMDVKNAIFDYKSFYAEYKKGDGCGNSYFTSRKHFNKIRTESSKVVSYLIKEFELRKNADQMKKSSIAKTGDLNLNKVFSYQFNEDIFKKISVMPNGKSHGLVMFLDWSGSMNNHITNTMKQLFNLVLFCKKAGIPYEVYAFTSESLHEKMFRFPQKTGDLAMSSFCLVNILSSKMTSAEFMYAGSVLCAISRIGRSEGSTYPWWTSLSSTPLNQAIVSAMYIVPEFQKQNKLQIVNTVFLTDGDSDNVEGVYEGPNHTGYLGTNRFYDVLVLRDPKTKLQEITENIHYSGSHITTGLVKLLKSKTNCNIVGFYVLANQEFSRKIVKYGIEQSSKQVEASAQFKKDNCFVVTSAGFDEYYLLRSQGLNIDDEAELEVKENATTRGLVSAFTKYTTSRLNNRVVLNRFIKMIA